VRPRRSGEAGTTTMARTVEMREMKTTQEKMENG
jgi:hypothetical protein